MLLLIPKGGFRLKWSISNSFHAFSFLFISFQFSPASSIVVVQIFDRFLDCCSPRSSVQSKWLPYDDKAENGRFRTVKLDIAN
jgi:hypothetical protein